MRSFGDVVTVNITLPDIVDDVNIER